MESVAFYSYKGGVGRSLLLVNTARFLALSGRRVVALDLDFEAPGLHYKTGVDARVRTGAVHLLQRSLEGDLPTLDEVREAAVEVPMPATHGGWLRLLAAGPSPTAEYWADLGRLHERLAAGQDAGLLEAVLDLQTRIEDVWNPDVLLVDARTGVTGLGGIATMALCERVVLVTTRTRESLDGTLAVAESLRATPTLCGEERRLELVVSRVQGTETIADPELREQLGEYFELPHDRYDGGAERLLGDGPPPKTGNVWESTRGESLLAATLIWIAKAFHAEEERAIHARSRLLAVEETWRELTDWRNRPGGRPEHERWHWSADMLATDIEFHGFDGSARTADIVAKLDGGELAMVIEYLDEPPGPDVVHWWREHVQPRVIVLQWGEDEGEEPVLETMRTMVPGRRDSGEEVAVRSTREALPSPVEFDLLPDPTARSVDAMLDVAPRTRFYDDALIMKWKQSSAVSLYGDRGHAHEQARKILNALASIDDPERVKQVAWGCIGHYQARHRYLRPEAPDEEIDRLVLDDLCAPLCWRYPSDSFIDIWRSFRFVPTPVFYAIRRLAGFMGLYYDPYVAFRRAATGSVEHDDGTSSGAPKARELRFEWSGNFLPRSSAPEHGSPRSELRSPGYQGHLGSYTPATGCIVLAGPAVEGAASALGRASRYVGSVALLHLCVLGMLHNGIDLDGQRWEGFSLEDGGVPPVIVALVQFFVHRFLGELDDERLMDAFEALTEVQPPEYGAWQAMTHVSLEDGRAWMMSTRCGLGVPGPIDLDLLLRAR